MKFFNIDQHISVIADLKQIFGNLGHTIDDICLSGHAAIMGRQKDSVPMLDGDNWCGLVQRKAWDEFFSYYPLLDDWYDGFICCYPPLFSYLYRRYKKPIIIDIPIRYEYPCQSSKEDWEGFNEYLQEGVDNKKIYLVANNMYDKIYTELFLQRQVEYIPSLCEYTNAHYNPKRNEFLYYSAKPYDELKGTNFKRKNDTLPFGHTWQEVADYSGVVHFPYNVSTMSTFEHFSAGIPIFCPSIDFLMELYSKGKQYRVLEQVTWAGTFGRAPGSVIEVPSMYDPNDFNDTTSVKYWLQFADYYYGMKSHQMIHFDSFSELERKSTHINLDEVSLQMKNVFNYVKKEVYDKWECLLEQVKNDHKL